MRSLPDQRIELAGRHLQIAGDPDELRGVDLADLAELPPVLQPVGEGLDQLIGPRK